MNDVVQIVLPLALAPLDYLVPGGEAVAEGQVVEVPLGRRRVYGVVWGAGSGEVPREKLRPLVRLVDVTPFSTPFRAFIDWVAEYTLSPPGAVLAMALSVPDALAKTAPQRAYRLTLVPVELRMTPARERVLAVLEEEAPLEMGEILARAEVGRSVVNGLVEHGALEAVEQEVIPPAWKAFDAEAMQAPQLSAAQQAAADTLAGKVTQGRYSATLLDGVTGSGKTEVYAEAIAAALTAGKQALVLLPEIVLTTQLLMRFRARFGIDPVLWHSSLTPKTRRENWRAIAGGEAKLVIGARSALFLPFSTLGVVVVDEEHEGAYKQEDGVVYHGRDMAVARAFCEELPVILVSATPSLESMVNVERGKFDRVHLPKRHGAAELPTVELVDMRYEPMERQSWISTPLKEAMAETLARGEQALLFLNRRGYAPLMLCRKCGHRLQCKICTAWMVAHQRPPSLQCHHCGARETLPESCPECGAEGSLVACGPGVERLAEEVQTLFPEARIAQMTSDAMTSPAVAEALVERVMAGEVDVIIGTQMVAKGHHFPLLTCVGVVDADLGLEGGDLRAAEKSFQLLHQVAGRAGREGRPGRALLQTYAPEHPVMQALVAGDRDQFLQHEEQTRRMAAMPPFGRLAALVFAGTEEALVRKTAAEYVAAAPEETHVQVLGPAPAPLARLRGRYRYRVLVKAGRDVALQRYLRRWRLRTQPPRSVKMKIDVDPYSFV